MEAVPDVGDAVVHACGDGVPAVVLEEVPVDEGEPEGGAFDLVDGARYGGEGFVELVDFGAYFGV